MAVVGTPAVSSKTTTAVEMVARREEGGEMPFNASLSSLPKHRSIVRVVRMQSTTKCTCAHCHDRHTTTTTTAATLTAET